MMRFKEWLDEGFAYFPFDTAKIRASLLKARKTFPEEMAPKEFQKKISNVISRSGAKMISFKLKTESSFDPDAIAITANYDVLGDETNANKFINLYIVTNNKKVILNDFAWDHIISEIPDVIAHEMQHANQARKREFVPGREMFKKYKDNKNAQYYGNDDEIEAYALDISKTILRKYGYKKGISILKKIKPIKDVDDFNEYIDIFGPRHKVVKKLIKKILLFMDIYRDEEF